MTMESNVDNLLCNWTQYIHSMEMFDENSRVNFIRNNLANLFDIRCIPLFARVYVMFNGHKEHANCANSPSCLIFSIFSKMQEP